MDLIKSILVSASAMKAQGQRMEVIAENIANADSLGQRAGEDPYQRKVLTFRNLLDRSLGVEKVLVNKIDVDRSDFPKRFDPGHPAADATGYVLTPNVNALVEMMDMREAQRSYEANLSMVETAKGMLTRTIDLIR
jgi:flagellar basal-body rod protein FlgC